MGFSCARRSAAPARDPRKRAARALSRHSGRAAHLDRPSRSRASSSAWPARSTRCSTTSPIRRPALQPVGRFRHHGGAGRHAQLLGPAARRGVFVVLQDYLSSLTVNWMSFVGMLFVLVVLFFPRGCSASSRARATHEPARGRNVTGASAAWSRSSGVSLSVAPGELRAVIGPNGAGKTTFFNLISGFFPPSSGRSPSTAATSRVAAASARRARHGAHLPDHRDLSRTDSVFENVRIAVEVAAGYRLRPGSAPPEGDAIGRRSTRRSSWRRLAPRPTAWSASSPTATSAPPRS
jgi:hypothetical protein